MKKILLFAALITSSTFIFAQAKPVDTRQTTQKLNFLLQLINYNYVESVDQPKLVETAIESMLKELDPHSVYIPKKEVERVNEPLVGNFEGIGVTFQLFHDTILVVSPVPGGPSDKLGILAGDKIIKINGEDATGSKVNNQYVMDRLRGPKGTTVEVSIYRKSRAGLIDYKIVRDKIPLNSIDATFMVTDQIGYIKLSRFARSSANEFRESVEELKKQGMKSLILDLRGNTGGYLDIAIELGDQFLSSEKLIVYTEGLHSLRNDDLATSRGVFEDGKLAVIIDESSASASEIVSGAVQDWDRGVIVGRRSFGKGLVQKPYLMPDSSMVRITTARYYTPSGRCIQKPYTDDVDAYRSEVVDRYKHGEFMHQDSIKMPDSLKFYTHNKRLVFGGGGIMPDVFVPLDTAFVSDYYTDILRKGLLNEFTVQYVDNHRNELTSKFKTAKDFKKGFTKEEELFNEFLAFSDKKEVKRTDAMLAASGKQIRYVLKGMIARNLFGVGAYFEVTTDNDDDLLKTIEILQNNQQYKTLTGN